jgi:hypothetical protein
MTRGLRLYLSSAGRSAVDFYRPLKSVASAWFEPMNLEFNGRHANHYTTEVTEIRGMLATIWSLALREEQGSV